MYLINSNTELTSNNFCRNIFKIDLNSFLDVNDKKMIEIKNYTKKKLLSEIKKNKYLEFIDVDINISSFEDQELYNIMYLLKLQKKELCDLIKKFFENNNLILQKKEK